MNPGYELGKEKTVVAFDKLHPHSREPAGMAMHVKSAGPRAPVWHHALIVL